MTTTSELDLAERIASATEPMRILGGGTRPVGGAVPGEVLDVSGLHGVTLYEPEALTLVVRAGTPLAEVETLLAGEGQRLAFEPADWRGLLGTAGKPTIGGMVAANVSGPRRVQAGACRDALIGVRFVDGTGTVVKNGGRVMKNVTGYDLVKLMAGSWGTLGVMTEVAFKLLPRPETVATLLCEGLSPEQAVTAMSDALGSPYEVTGAAHHRGSGRTLIRIEGFAPSVAYRAERLCARLARFGDWSPIGEGGGEWQSVRDVVAFHAVPGDVWCLAVKPSEAPGVAARAEAEDALFDWGGGRIWLRVGEGTDLRTRLGPFAGHATLIRATAETRARIAPFPPEVPPVAALSQALRARFDPRQILNPGLMD
ncbi:FAD-binding protein [Frigidibacter sp. RF13]|uniref:FAD-binding protein n=1 Tax=Frigidibacter sp. RF13 TaxID=2997340 RepID=UPI00226EB622|nr:FAD-binding protein [Frigidibacter sp. RF13]MCY1126859.1 FAD-binding protein [Frigidibacter sp. RF13]